MNGEVNTFLSGIRCHMPGILIILQYEDPTRPGPRDTIGAVESKEKQ